MIDPESGNGPPLPSKSGRRLIQHTTPIPASTPASTPTSTPKPGKFIGSGSSPGRSGGFGMVHHGILGEEVKKRVVKTLEHSIERDINDIVYWKFTFRKLGDWCESISQITTLSATVIAFLAGYKDEKFLSFIAGCLGSISLALLKASSYSYAESRERNTQLNLLLESNDFEEIPYVLKKNDLE